MRPQDLTWPAHLVWPWLCPFLQDLIGGRPTSSSRNTPHLCRPVPPLPQSLALYLPKQPFYPHLTLSGDPALQGEKWSKATILIKPHTFRSFLVTTDQLSSGTNSGGVPTLLPSPLLPSTGTFSTTWPSLPRLFTCVSHALRSLCPFLPR